MTCVQKLDQLMAGYDISDEEYDCLMDEAQEKESQRIAELAWEEEWKRQYRADQQRLEREEQDIEEYGHVLPDFYEGMPYAIYLDTHRWRATAKFVKHRDGERCRGCKATLKLQVHHLTYEHIYREIFHDHDLITLCESCHKKQHEAQRNAAAHPTAERGETDQANDGGADS